MFIRVKRSYIDTENATIDGKPGPKKVIELWLLNTDVIDSFRERTNEKGEKELVAVFKNSNGDDGLEVTLDHTREDIDKKLVEIKQLI